jgi:hypothetical protein
LTRGGAQPINYSAKDHFGHLASTIVPQRYDHESYWNRHGLALASGFGM